jgi:hypothetical protein
MSMFGSAGSSGSSEPTGSSEPMGGSGSSDNKPSTNKDASGNEMSSGMSDMLFGAPTTNTRDSQGNLVDASGNVITWNNEGSWLKFLKSLLHFFILSLLIGLFGSGFIYLTTRGSDLDNILPTYELFYSAASYEIQKNGPFTDVNCNETGSGSFGVFEDNFPYNLILTKGSSKSELQALSLVQRLTNWFAKTVAGTFKSNRALLKSWLDNFAPNTPLGNHTFQIYIGFPVTMLFSLVGFITGFWAAFGAAAAADMKVTVWGGFLLYAWALIIGLSCVIFLRLIGTICFLPMSQNWKEVANIMACNVKAIVILFGFFVCGAAYDNLETTVSGIMGIVYLLLVAHTVWKYFSTKI